MILAKGQIIGFSLLPEQLQEKTSTLDVSGFSAGLSLAEVEKEMIRKTLELTDGHRKRTAQMLGISERDLYYKLKKYQLK